MKRFILLWGLFFIYITSSFSQVYQITTANTKGDKYLIASLPKTSANNYQKLRIEILGGNFLNDNLGSRIYTVSTRNLNKTEDLVKIIQEQRGGASERYELKVYETNLGFDFVFETNETYVSVLIEVWLTSETEFNKPIRASSQEIRKYTATNGKDITHDKNLVQFVNIYTTDNTGNIGIGVTKPQATLDVNGTIRSKEVKIEATGWSDFVFGEKYQLPSLSEVENHIKEHKHLPDIPSEREVIENGISVGEMQAKLLQKIEELTLYVIGQQKEIESLKQKLKEQE